MRRPAASMRRPAALLAPLALAGCSGVSAGLDGDDMAGLAYLTLFLVLLAFSARGFLLRAPISDTVRNAVVWLGIVVLLVGGYSYREELQDVGHRVTLGLVPGSAVTRRNADGTARVSVGRDRSGHFVVTAEVEGAPVRFLVDTGATTVALTSEDARRIGIDPDRLSFTLPISTANGIGMAAPVRLESVALGDIERRDLEGTVAQPGMLSQSLLGMNFLGSLAAFEIRGDRLVLHD